MRRPRDLRLRLLHLLFHLQFTLPLRNERALLTLLVAATTGVLRLGLSQMDHFAL